MLNFYGGPNGQSFNISWIFATRYGGGNSMESDINMGWRSPISVGSYVVISYGEPNSTDYEYYLNQDFSVNNKSYNSTLWEKIYDENTNVNNGISYRLIMSMAGFTPRIEFTKPIDVLDADQLPDIIYDNTNIDKPKIKFRLPQSQVLSMEKPITILDADQMPEVIYDDSNINRPVLKFKIPQSQRIQQGAIHWLKANQDPRFELDLTDINRPVLSFWLPVAQEIQEGDITVLDADEKPYFHIDSTDPDNPILSFWLPQSQIMQDPTTTVIGPDQKPSVSLNDSNINQPKLEFELPRAVAFYYGSLLGERQNSPYTLTNAAFADYGVGDYYINEASGFIYKVISVSGTTCVFEYVASIQQPLPDVTTVDISPYKIDGTQNPPKVTRTFTNNDQTAWKIEFQLPKIPFIDVGATFVGAAEDGSATASVKDEDTVKFDFEIPRGSRMFAGTDVKAGHQDAVVPEAKAGDLYLNADTGIIYILDKSGMWVIQQGSLKGPVGDALHVVRTYETTLEDTFNNGRDLIISQYVDTNGDPLPYKPDEIFAVTFKDTSLDKETSYWYFFTEDNKWGRVQLTGGVMNLIENTYQESPESAPITNKTYSIDYINKLIGGKIDSGNMDKVAFSKDQIFDLLSWGTWEDAIAGDDIPEPEGHDTLSAEEVIELMSWGSISKLAI